MAAAFGKPRSERLAAVLSQTATAKTRTLPWALSVLDGVYDDLEAQVRSNLVHKLAQTSLETSLLAFMCTS